MITHSLEQVSNEADLILVADKNKSTCEVTRIPSLSDMCDTCSYSLNVNSYKVCKPCFKPRILTNVLLLLIKQHLVS